MDSTEQAEPDSDQRLFQCRTCGQSFTKSEHLVRHVRTHTREKPFQCPICGRRYGRQDILNRHRRHVRCKKENSQPRSVLTDGDRGSFTNQADNEINPLHAPMLQTITPTNDMETTCIDPPHLSDQYLHPFPSPVTLQDVGLPTDSSQLTLEPLAALATQPCSIFRPPLPSETFPNGPDGGEQVSSWAMHADLHDDLLGIDLTAFGYNAFSASSMEDDMDDDHAHARSVHRLWFTHAADETLDTLYPEPDLESFPTTTSGITTPYSAGTTIDDRYRRRLQERLKILSYEPTIPSVNLLNIWARLYFSKFHPIFPIIHAATFRPCRANTSLLIAMCSVGALFTGSDQGLRQGTHLFERIHKATLQNWERLCAKDQGSLLPIIQTAVISQAFGLLAGCPTLLLTVDAFHGPPVAWARQLRLHKSPPRIHVDESTESPELDQIWREWARNEEVLRLTHALYIIDAELANLLHHEPLHNFHSYNFVFASSEKAFMASNAQDWKRVYLRELQERTQLPKSTGADLLMPDPAGIFQAPKNSLMTVYAILEGLNTQILSQWARGSVGQQVSAQFHQTLYNLHKTFILPLSHLQKDELQLQVLWHSVCMSTFADFDFLEKAVGREGCKLNVDELSVMSRWADSKNALRCALHGLVIQMFVQRASRMSEFAIHTPRVLFWAAIALLCYAHFGTHTGQLQWLRKVEMADSQELFSLGLDDADVLSELSQILSEERIALSTIVFAMIDLLRHGGHWELARKFADILTTVTSFKLKKSQHYH